MNYKPLSKEERRIADIMNSCCHSMDRLFQTLVPREEEYRGIICTRKCEGNNSGQYGYYTNTYTGELYIIMKRLGIKSLVDLGSGPGILLTVLNNFDYGLTLRGYEIEKSLSRIDTSGRVYTEDIFTLTKEDIDCFEAIYFWEPMESRELCEKFVSHLEKIVRKGQYIIYRPSGFIKEFLEKSEIIKPMIHYTKDWNGKKHPTNHFNQYYLYKI